MPGTGILGERGVAGRTVKQVISSSDRCDHDNKIGDLMGVGRNHFGLYGQRRHPLPKTNHTDVKVKALSQRISLMLLVTHQSDAPESSSTKTTTSRALERRREEECS